MEKERPPEDAAAREGVNGRPNYGGESGAATNQSSWRAKIRNKRFRQIRYACMGRLHCCEESALCMHRIALSRVPKWVC
jgi:hypothetical protein